METLGICLICTLQNAPDLIYSGWPTYRWDPPPRPPLRGRVGPGHHTPNSMPSPSLHHFRGCLQPLRGARVAATLPRPPLPFARLPSPFSVPIFPTISDCGAATVWWPGGPAPRSGIFAKDDHKQWTVGYATGFGHYPTSNFVGGSTPHFARLGVGTNVPGQCQKA